MRRRGGRRTMLGSLWGEKGGELVLAAVIFVQLLGC